MVELLIVLTLPGLVLLLIGYAAGERVLNRTLPSRHGRRAATAAAGFDVMHGALAPGRDIELEQKRVERFLRDDDEAAAPPRTSVDLHRRLVRMQRPAGRSDGVDTEAHR